MRQSWVGNVEGNKRKGSRDKLVFWGPISWASLKAQ